MVGHPIQLAAIRAGYDERALSLSLAHSCRTLPADLPVAVTQKAAPVPLSQGGRSCQETKDSPPLSLIQG